jgi:cysteine desulfurase / selenocysteine lyase
MTIVATGCANLNAAEIRKDFPIFAAKNQGKRPLVYLDNAASTQHPQVVIDAVRVCYETQYANVHRGIHRLSELATALYEASRESVRDLIHAEKSEEVIFTSGTTAGINLVARSWGDQNCKAGDEVLLTEMEHHSNIVPWFQLAERTGCTVRFCPITDDGTVDLEVFQNHLSDRTRIVAVTAVSNVLGTINPIEKMVSLAHTAGAKVLVDAAQAVPHEPIDVRKWNAEFVVFSGHKMLAPSGVGILYGKAELLDSMPAFMGGGSMIRTVSTKGYTLGELPARFEAGTPPIVQAIGMKPAIDYLRAIGLDNICNHERALTEQAHQGLSEIEGLRILGPSLEHKAGIVSFVVDGVSPQDLTKMIDFDGIALRGGHHCAMPLHARYGLSNSTRASFYIYNTREEVDFFVSALGKTIEKLR